VRTLRIVHKCLFSTSDIKTVHACRKFFGFALPSVELSKRAAEFENRLCERLLPRRIYNDTVEFIVDPIWTAIDYLFVSQKCHYFNRE